MTQLSYFEWLIDQIQVPVRPARSYDGLWKRMLQTEFVATVSLDDNRVQDGLDLRVEFDYGYRHHHYDRTAPCTFLEVLVALSRRIAFDTDDDAPGWAWQLVINLGLDKLYDPVRATRTRKIDEILQALIWRTYEPNGQGGFFPLQFPDGDQTCLQIWHQMSSYVAELPE